jgi:hypothetical protein
MTNGIERRLRRAGAIAGMLGMATLPGACSASDNAPGASGLEDGGGGSSSGSGATSGTHTNSPTPMLGQPSSGGSSGSQSASGGSGAADGNGTPPPPPPPPPEKELESAFEAPVATDRYVWTANPTTGRVALIGAHDFSVRLAEAGLAPTTVAALSGNKDEDAAIVLNAGSNDATILRVDASGELRSTTVSTHAGANSVTVSPQGGYAVIWTDAAKFAENSLDPTDGLQDVTVVKFDDPPTTTALSVGYRPSQVSFDTDEKRAFVVTQPGLSVIELGDAPAPESLIELTTDAVDETVARDVTVTPDGRYAVVRVDGKMALGFVDLGDATLTELTLDDYVTDLDLSDDGKLAFAVSGGALVVVPVPPPEGADPASFVHGSATGLTARSVSLSSDASLALLYSNAANSPYVGILSANADLSSYGGRAVDVKAPVLAAFAAPDAQHGIAFQSTASGSTKGGAFSIVSAQENRAPKVIGTDAAPMAVAFAPDGDKAVIATRDLTKKSYGVYLVGLTNLEQNLVKLASPPLSAGIVPAANRAFVAQAHPEGRITFVDLDDASEHTLTGFELAAKVMQ